MGTHICRQRHRHTNIHTERFRNGRYMHTHADPKIQNRYRVGTSSALEKLLFPSPEPRQLLAFPLGCFLGVRFGYTIRLSFVLCLRAHKLNIRKVKVREEVRQRLAGVFAGKTEVRQNQGKCKAKVRQQ